MVAIGRLIWRASSKEICTFYSSSFSSTPRPFEDIYLGSLLLSNRLDRFVRYRGNPYPSMPYFSLYLPKHQTEYTGNAVRWRSDVYILRSIAVPAPNFIQRPNHGSLGGQRVLRFLLRDLLTVRIAIIISSDSVFSRSSHSRSPTEILPTCFHKIPLPKPTSLCSIQA